MKSSRLGWSKMHNKGRPPRSRRALSYSEAQQEKEKKEGMKKIRNEGLIKEERT